jgi:hypothetical protein
VACSHEPVHSDGHRSWKCPLMQRPRPPVAGPHEDLGGNLAQARSNGSTHPYGYLNAITCMVQPCFWHSHWAGGRRPWIRGTCRESQGLAEAPRGRILEPACLTVRNHPQMRHPRRDRLMAHELRFADSKDHCPGFLWGRHTNARGREISAISRGRSPSSAAWRIGSR